MTGAGLSEIATLNSARLMAAHDAVLASWYADRPNTIEPGDDVASLVAAQHFCNFSLWGLEDEARRRGAADNYIADTKRAIDGWNQRRNDLAERVDRAVLRAFSGVDISRAALHSETAGMMVDRLSILALKIWHMGEYADDPSNPAVAAECREKQALLRVQRADLAGCLDALLAGFAAGQRHFKLYRQFKAYNDPRLNPALRNPGA
jgi:hypothetical protein